MVSDVERVPIKFRDNWAVTGPCQIIDLIFLDLDLSLGYVFTGRWNGSSSAFYMTPAYFMRKLVL